MQHVKEDLTQLKSEVAEIRRDTKADFEALRQDSRRSFDDIKREIASSVGSLSTHLDEKIAQINSHVSHCSQTNGARLNKLEHENSHAKGMTKGAVAVIGVLASVFGAAVALILKVVLQ